LIDFAFWFNQSGQVLKMENREFSPRREMIKGNWTCSGCGATITELPFEPDGERPIYCRDCHRQKRAERPNRY
jgi:CxxC-x17-CxxC domain-containing protein